MSNQKSVSTDRPPVIILGAARSGTRLLRSLVAATGCYAEVPYDVNYIWRVGNETHPHDALRPEHLTDRTRRFIRERVGRCAGLPAGDLAFVEKTVSNVLRAGFVRAVFPEAKFIFLVRDGRDVTESAERSWREPPKVGYLFDKLRTFPWMRCAPYGWKYAHSVAGRMLRLTRQVSTWGPRYPGIAADVHRLSLVEVCARQWLASIEYYERARHVFARDQLLELRYEDLVQSTDAALARLVEFLRVDEISAVRRFADETIRRERIGSHSRLNSADCRRALDLISPALNRWGYAPGSHNVRAA
jgi:hypothetical protein